MKLFGTDGIRGTANRHPMTAEIALKLGMAAGAHFNRGTHRHRAVIAKDTRLSGYLLEPALTSGLIAAGVDVVLVGPLPTPAVAMLTRAMRADLGIMLSASHNAYADNGIKLFGPDGHKLSREEERAIERRIHENDLPAAAPDALGRAKRLEDARGRYIEFAKATFPKSLTLDGLKIVLDCAHGAAYQVGPLILSELGAKVIPLSVAPDGFNINAACGSTDAALMCETVRATGADLGIALDGDADRVILCDENGALLDGDQLMGMIARFWHRSGRLTGGAVVATHMSNLGLERFLAAEGLPLIRTDVGDRFVAEAMRARGCNVGGEQSGHVILSDYSTTGDGLVAALQALAVMVETCAPLSACGRVFEPLPQLLKNVRFEGASPLASPDVTKAIEAAGKMLAGRGRVLVRASGTEPLIRVMAEGEDAGEIERVVGQLCDTIQSAA